MTLQTLLDSFRNDKRWNTENRDGSHRFDKEITWIEEMIKDYAKALGIKTDAAATIIESQRNYSWPNYYQPANFPPLDSKDIIGVFDTVDAFKEHFKRTYKGFKCQKCGNIGRHPQECDHRIAKDGVCDWASYGLFKSGIQVVILESGIKPIDILPPVPKDKE